MLTFSNALQLQFLTKHGSQLLLKIVFSAEGLHIADWAVIRKCTPVG